MKKTIEAIIMNYRALIEQTAAEVKAVDSDERYSNDYKAKSTQEIHEKFSTRQAEFKQQILNLIQQERNIIADRQRLKDHGPNYDIKLSNTLKILQLTMGNMSDQEILSVVEPFQGDYSTMNILWRVLQTGGKEGLVTPDMLQNEEVFALSEMEKMTNQIFTRPYSQSESSLLGLGISLHYFQSVLPA